MSDRGWLSLRARALESVKRSFEIVNKLGLHARAAAQFVKVASAFDAELTITRDDQTVNGKSIMGVMMLAAGLGSTIELEATGEDSRDLLDALGELISHRFHEDQ